MKVQGTAPTADIWTMATAPNRRIGERLATPDLTITWEVTRKGRFRTRTGVEPVRVLNASPTGAALVAPTVPGLGVRSKVPLHVDGHDVVAQIRREEPTAIVGMTAYGVQFVDPDPAAIDFLLEQGGSDDRAALESLWQRSH